MPTQFSFLLISKKIIQFAADCLFPKTCLGCGQLNTYLCADCFQNLGDRRDLTCYACHRRSPNGKICKSCRRKNRTNLTGLFVAGDWDNRLLKQLIYVYKYRFIKELAEPLAGIAAEYLKINFLSGENKNTENIILIPAPLHPRRLAWRGFNQAELLTKKIAEILRITVAEKILVRQSYSSPQANIKNRTERELNVQNVFLLTQNADQKIDSLKMKNKTVILVDDVATTGATLEQCAATIKPLGPKEIWGLVIARG